MRPALLLAVISLSLAACSGRYMGLDGQALDSDIAQIAERARLGNKQAQFDLGLRFANGDGVPKDCERARQLFRTAARASGGTIWVYSPPVTKGGRGQVIPVNSGPVMPGLIEAQFALQSQALCPVG